MFKMDPNMVKHGPCKGFVARIVLILSIDWLHCWSG